MTVPGFIVLSAALAASLAAASAAALVLYRKVRRMRRTEEALARILGALRSWNFHTDLGEGIRELRDLAGSAEPGPAAKALNAAAALASRLSETIHVYSEYREGRTLPPCFVPQTLGPDGILRGLGRAEGPGCEASGYAAWPYRSGWLEFQTANPRFAWFIYTQTAGIGFTSGFINIISATLVRNEFDGRKNSLHRPETLPEILYRVNEHIEGQGFARKSGRFVVTCLGLWDRQEKEAILCGAGVERLRRWNPASRSVERVELPQSPPIGVFPYFMFEMKNPFTIARSKLDTGNILFLINNFIDESHRFIRDGACRIKTETKPLPDGTVREEKVSEFFGSDRIDSLLSAVGSRSTWRLEKQGGLPGEEDLVFDFSSCEGRPEDFALALAAAERIFRMYPDPGAGPEDRVYLDPETDAFLVRHFSKVGFYRKEGMVRVLEGKVLDREGGDGTSGDGRVVAWGGVREDRYYDDVFILAIGRKD